MDPNTEKVSYGEFKPLKLRGYFVRQNPYVLPTDYIYVFSVKVKVSRDRPRWPKGFRVD